MARGQNTGVSSLFRKSIDGARDTPTAEERDRLLADERSGTRRGNGKPHLDAIGWERYPPIQRAPQGYENMGSNWCQIEGRRIWYPEVAGSSESIHVAGHEVNTTLLHLR